MNKDESIFGNWDENLPETDFLSEIKEDDSNLEKIEPPSSGKKELNIIDINPETEEKKRQEELDKESDIDFFSNEEDIEEDEKLSEENIPSTGDPSVSTVEYLKKKGFIDYELEGDLTPTLAEEILEDAIEDKTDDKIKELFKDLPPVVKELTRYAMKGGDVNQYLAKINNPNKNILRKNLDLSLEKNQELVVRNSLNKEGYDKEYIDTQVDFLKEKGKLFKVSKTHFDRWKKEDQREQQRILQEQDRALKAERDNIRNLRNKVNDFLKSNDEIKGLTITREDRKIIPNYMTERKVKLENGNYITEMQRDIYAALADNDKTILIAKLLKNDFNFDEINKKATTKVTQQVKNNIRRSKNGIPKNSSGSVYKNSSKTLADYF